MEALSRGKSWGPENKSLVQLQVLKDLKKECSTDLKLGSMGMGYCLIGVAPHVQEESGYAMLKKKVQSEFCCKTLLLQKHGLRYRQTRRQPGRTTLLFLSQHCNTFCWWSQVTNKIVRRSSPKITSAEHRDLGSKRQQLSNSDCLLLHL